MLKSKIFVRTKEVLTSNTPQREVTPPNIRWLFSTFNCKNNSIINSTKKSCTATGQRLTTKTYNICTVEPNKFLEESIIGPPPTSHQRWHHLSRRTHPKVFPSLPPSSKPHPRRLVVAHNHNLTVFLPPSPLARLLAPPSPSDPSAATGITEKSKTWGSIKFKHSKGT